MLHCSTNKRTNLFGRATERLKLWQPRRNSGQHDRDNVFRCRLAGDDRAHTSWRADSLERSTERKHNGNSMLGHGTLAVLRCFVNHRQNPSAGRLDPRFLSPLPRTWARLGNVKCMVSTLSLSRLTSILLSVVLASSAYGQSITQDMTIVSAAQAGQLGDPLEKVVDYFTSTTVPGLVVGFHPDNGTPGGLYLYTSTSGSIAGPWQQTALASSGDAYEGAVAFTYPGDTYPGVIASIQPAGSSNLQIIWYENPKNLGLDPTTLPWGVQVINPNNGCHALRLADMDGDGKLDVVCSAAPQRGTGSFIAFQNNYNDWQLVNNVANLAEDVDVIAIAGSDSPHLVGANLADGNIYWYQNRCTRVPFRQSTPCSASRTAGWTAHKINSDNAGTASGNSFTTITISGVDGVIAADNEEDDGLIYTPGVAWFYPGANPSSPWNMVDLDSTYRSVHQISTGTWNGGTPYTIVAEEEQACPPAMPNGHPPNHQTPCRIAIFQYVNGTWQQTVLSQNQHT
jgi:hypothetical protein